jgi:hypothetical protein
MNYQLIRSVIRFLGMSIVAGAAVAIAYPIDTKPEAGATKLNKPNPTTTNRMQKRPAAAKPAGGTQLEYEKPAQVNSTLVQKGTVSGGNNKSKSGGNAKVSQNNVNKAGWDLKRTPNKGGYQLGGSHGDDTPTEKSPPAGGSGGAGAKSKTPAKSTSPIKQ